MRAHETVSHGDGGGDEVGTGAQGEPRSSRSEARSEATGKTTGTVPHIEVDDVAAVVVGDGEGRNATGSWRRG